MIMMAISIVCKIASTVSMPLHEIMNIGEKGARRGTGCREAVTMRRVNGCE